MMYPIILVKNSFASKQDVHWSYLFQISFLTGLVFIFSNIFLMLNVVERVCVYLKPANM